MTAIGPPTDRPSLLAGLIGCGIQASLTPTMHEREGAAQGLRYVYRRIDLDILGLGVEALPELLAAAEHMGFDGLNITFPCKQAVLPLQELTVSGSVDPTAGVKMPVSIAKVTTDQLIVPSTNSALASIQGKVAGASIIRGSGQPGSGVSIMFRSPTAARR